MKSIIASVSRCALCGRGKMHSRLHGYRYMCGHESVVNRIWDEADNDEEKAEKLFQEYRDKHSVPYSRTY